MDGTEGHSSFTDYLASLLDDGDVWDETAVGITRKVIGDGEESLSSKQRYVFQKRVLEPFGQRDCTLCQDTIPWDDMEMARFRVLFGEPWLCSRCDYRLSKDD